VLTSRAIVIWNSHTGVVIKQLLGNIDDVYAVAWSPDGKYLASLAQSQDNTVRLWNVATGHQLYTVRPVGYGAMENLAWSPNGQYLAVQMQVQVGNNTLGAIVTRDEIQVWRALTHQIVTTFPSPSAGDGFNGFSWAPDSRRIVTAIGSSGAQDNEVLIWNATTGQNLYIFQGTYPEGVAWSPDGKYIVQEAWQYTSSGQGVRVTEVWLAPAGTPGSATTS